MNLTIAFLYSSTTTGRIIFLSWFPFIVLILSFIGLWFYPIKGERLKENRKHLTELYAQKREENT
jgi:Na+/melibiose symporter-like transporter